MYCNIFLYKILKICLKYIEFSNYRYNDWVLPLNSLLYRKQSYCFRVLQSTEWERKKEEANYRLKLISAVLITDLI